MHNETFGHRNLTNTVNKWWEHSWRPHYQGQKTFIILPAISELSEALSHWWWWLSWRKMEPWTSSSQRQYLGLQSSGPLTVGAKSPPLSHFTTCRERTLRKMLMFGQSLFCDLSTIYLPSLFSPELAISSGNLEPSHKAIKDACSNFIFSLPSKFGSICSLFLL